MEKLKYDLVAAKDNKLIASAGKRLNVAKLKELKKLGYDEILIINEQMSDKVSVCDFTIKDGLYF